MEYVGLIIGFFAAIWVFLDAKDRGKGGGVAYLWFLGVFIIWAIFLPLWLIVRQNNQEPHTVKPVKAIVIGLLLCFLCLSIISTLIALVYGTYLGIDFSSHIFPQELANYYPYLFSDFAISVLFLLWCGKYLTKYSPGEEIKYALIVGILTSLIGVAVTLLDFRAYSAFPLWYMILSVLLTPVLIYYGAKFSIKNS